MTYAFNISIQTGSLKADVKDLMIMIGLARLVSPPLRWHCPCMPCRFMRGCMLGSFAKGAAVVLHCGEKKHPKVWRYCTDAAPAIVKDIKEQQGALASAGAAQAEAQAMPLVLSLGKCDLGGRNPVGRPGR